MNILNLLENGLIDYLPKTIVIMLITYLAIKILDFLSGLLKTWKIKNYKSSKMRDGLIKWIAELIGVIFVILIDMMLGLEFYLCGLTLALFVYKECGSVIENLGQLGVELPNILKEKLEVLNKQEDDKKNN